MSASGQVKPTNFFADHPVFRSEDFVAQHSGDGSRSPQTSATVLKQHVASGGLLHLRRGVYATVPRGIAPQDLRVDPYLVATNLARDAVVAYHAALQFHGKTYSLWNRFHYLTRGRQSRFRFRGLEFVPVQVATALRSGSDLYSFGVVEHRQGGSVARVTTLERTLVDVLDAPERSGGWEEVWRSLELVEFFDLEAVVEYTRRLGTALTAARVGLFLEQHRDTLMVERRHLRPLRELSPSQPRYLDARRERGKLVTGWNLIVPEWILERAWADIG